MQTPMPNARLVHSILVGLRDNLPKGYNAEYVSVAIATLNEFEEISTGMRQSKQTSDLLYIFTNYPPEGLREEDELQYSLFIKQLFLEKECYGMVYEDPMASLALLGGAFQILKKHTDIDNAPFHYVEAGLDFLFHIALALNTMKEYKFAQHNLISILDVAAGVEAFKKTYETDDPDYVELRITKRAAPSAWLLARIFHDDEDEPRVGAAVGLADELYSTLVKSHKLNSIDHVAALLGYAEVLMMRDKHRKCIQMVEEAIHRVTTIPKRKITAKGAFLASVAFHKKAELYSVAESWDDARENFHYAMKWCSVAMDKVPLNTYFQDQHTNYMNELGIVHGVQGNLVEAQETFRRAITRSRKLAEQSDQHKSSLVAALSNMSVLMNRYGNLVVAKRYVEESLEVVESMETDDVTAPFATGRSELHEALTMSLNHIQEEMLKQKLAGWRPLWNSAPSSSDLN